MISSYCGFDREKVVCKKTKQTSNGFYCNMGGDTAITGRNFAIDDDRNVEMKVLSLDRNKNVHFLPVSVHQKFPYLISISARKCSIIEVSRENFSELTSLELVYLSDNRIYSLWSDTFAHLPALRKIFLGELKKYFLLFLEEFQSLAEGNNIKFINGQLLSQIKQLQEVWLRRNPCIDKDFTRNFDVQAMHQEVTTQCGFPEPKARGREVSCFVVNYVEKDKYDCCRFENFATINTKDFLISNALDYDISSLEARNCPKVNFLPIFVNFKFPNLQTYRAVNCNISEITKNNFANLTKLREIDLAGNKIDTVLKNSFEGLDLLLKIYLSKFIVEKNVLKSMFFAF